MVRLSEGMIFGVYSIHSLSRAFIIRKKITDTNGFYDSNGGGKCYS